MPNGTYGGVRGRKTKEIGGKLRKSFVFLLLDFAYHIRTTKTFAIYAVSRGWSINAFARYVGINYRVIERAFKTGDIKISTLKEILEKLNIQVEWIWRQER